MSENPPTRRAKRLMATGLTLGGGMALGILASFGGCKRFRSVELPWVKPVMPGSAFRLSLFPDNERVVFDLGEWGRGIHTINLKTGERSVITKSGKSQLGYTPKGATVSPSGDTVTYEVYPWTDAEVPRPKERSQIITLNLATNERHPLSIAGPMAVGPSYSHDGSRIAFFRASQEPFHYLLPDGWVWELFTVHPGGAGEARVSGQKYRLELIYPPSFSPDDRELVFSGCSTPPSPSKDRDCQIYLVAERKTERITDGDPKKMWATFAPDGKQAYFVGESFRPGEGFGFEYDIWAIDLASRALRRITNDHSWKTSPIPTADGKRILFMVTPPGANEELWSVSIDGSDLKRIAPLSGESETVSP